MSRPHEPHCRIQHELEPLDGSEPEPCSAGTVTEGDTTVTHVFDPEPGIILDSRGAFIPIQRARDWCQRVQGLLH